MKKIISFENQSESFAHGVEYGRLLEKIERGDDVIMNNGFPVRIENIQTLKDTCKHYGYIPYFGKTYQEEWIEFIGIKRCSIN